MNTPGWQRAPAPPCPPAPAWRGTAAPTAATPRTAPPPEGPARRPAPAAGRWRARRLLHPAPRRSGCGRCWCSRLRVGQAGGSGGGRVRVRGWSRKEGEWCQAGGSGGEVQDVWHCSEPRASRNPPRSHSSGGAAPATRTLTTTTTHKTDHTRPTTNKHTTHAPPSPTRILVHQTQQAARHLAIIGAQAQLGRLYLIIPLQ